MGRESADFHITRGVHADYRPALKQTIAFYTNCVKLILLAIEVGYHYLTMIGNGRETNQG